MKKIVVFINIMCSLFLFVGCRVSRNFPFLYDLSEVECIEIVEVNGEGYGLEPPMRVMKAIPDKQAFLEDFLKLDCYTVYGDPQGLLSGDTAIKIEYQNGSYQLIAESGTAQYSYNEYYGKMCYDPYMVISFNDEQLREFILTYL